MKNEKIVLSLSTNYVSHWTVYDALRELYQNIFDRAKEEGSAKWFSETETTEKGINLSLGNYNTEISKRTLILGETTKKENAQAIGKFGEGYKLAILVLLRNKIKVEVLTGSEKWTFKLLHNKQFDTKMLTVYVEHMEDRWSDLTFNIINLSSKLWTSYSQYNLNLQNDYEFIKTRKCEILTGKRNLNKIFVGGLYVCPYSGTSLYGYNFNPETFPIGRDRNIIEGFNANWEASQALVNASINNIELLNNVVANSTSDDSQYMDSFLSSTSAMTKALWNKFSAKYPNSLPVVDEDERKVLNKMYTNGTFIVVTRREYKVLLISEGYDIEYSLLEKRPPKSTPTEIVNGFYDKYIELMSSDLKKAFATELMTEAINWKRIKN